MDDQVGVRYKVLRGHKHSYERVAVGHRGTEWTSRLWCTSSQEESGWVTEDLLDVHGNGTATVVRDHSSIELTVTGGEQVTGFEVVGGWIRCRDNKGKAGWLPPG